MKVALMVTCLVDQFYPQVGEAMMRILHHYGITLHFPQAQTCCGQPAFNSGYTEEARAAGRTLLQAFADFDVVVSPSGSCTGMIHHYFPALFAGTQDEAEALALVHKTYEFSSFLVHVLGIAEVDALFPARVTYHPSCHATRLLGVRDEPLQLLSSVRELEWAPLEQAQDCCGFGGTFAVKMADLSAAMVDEKATHVRATKAEVLVGTDMGCLMNIGGRLRSVHADMRVLHLAELLWEGIQRAQTIDAALREGAP